MKSWHCHDEILGVASDEICFADEIKSATANPALAGFHREAISSTAGAFLPQKADLVEKTHIVLVDKCVFFLGGDRRARTFDLTDVNRAL